MSGRTRNIVLRVAVTEDEEEIIRRNMSAIGTTNFSLYARKMLLDGYIVKKDFAALKEITKVLGELSRHIHQIAKRANETRNLYAQDYEDIRNAYFKINAKIKEQLIKAIKE